MKRNPFELKSVFKYRPHAVTGNSFFDSSCFWAPATTPAIIPSESPSFAFSSPSSLSLVTAPGALAALGRPPPPDPLAPPDPRHPPEAPFPPSYLLIG